MVKFEIVGYALWFLTDHGQSVKLAEYWTWENCRAALVSVDSQDNWTNFSSGVSYVCVPLSGRGTSGE